LNTRERIAPPPQQKTRVIDDIADLAGNRPWVVLFFLALIIMVTITLRNTTSAYYFKYYVGRPELLSAFIPAYMAAAAAGAALTPVMTRFIDKKRLMMLLMSLTAVLSSAFFFLDQSQVTLMFALQIALGFVLGPKSPLAFSMYADTADYNEWRTGRRATAMTFAAATFSQKLGTALAVAVIGALFTTLGYVPNATQSSGSQAGIVWLMSLIPAFFAALAVGVMFFYNLDKQKLVQIQSELAARKAL
jgi:GPH family glycoside/pentoside/hexuronide:cation symporter